MTFSIANHCIGDNQPCFIIAEAGVNHNGDINLAKQLVDVAVRARVDAVKFQTFIAEKVMSLTAPKARYQKQTTAADESQIEMVRKFQLPFEAFREIKNYCDAKKIMFLSTPFDDDSADFLDGLGVPAFKIPSGEIVNHPFLEQIARTGKPIILSTGMSRLSEVKEALRVIDGVGNNKVALLHCVSNYPASPADCNLSAMATMRTVFGLPVGFSDHTLGCDVAVAAVALGACIIEKHFTMDRTLPGPDHKASLDSHGLEDLVSKIRTVESALGNGVKEPAKSEEDVAMVARRSIFLTCDVQEGCTLLPDMVCALRPAGGIPPSQMSSVLGHRASRSLKAGVMLHLQDVK